MRLVRHSTAPSIDAELIIDNFAGGGGASMGIEDALGRAVSIAINHDREAIGMHEANHPHTLHLCEDVFDVDPVKACGGRPVGLAWFSPDCKHFSKAKGGKPVDKRIRGLAWVVIKWARAVRPRIIMLENVEEFATWGPLGDDNRPCPRRRGRTFRTWVGALRRLGYAVEWRELRACDYGVPTIRKRFFLIARRDGEPIVWPRQTHARPEDHARLGLPCWRPAAGCIDWWRPCPSIFTRKRPLAEKTLQRIARGVVRFVINAQQPFIVTCNHGGDHFRGQSVDAPMCTLTAARDAHGLVAPVLIPRYGERDGQRPRCRSVQSPMPAVVPTANGARVVLAFLAKHYGGVVGNEVRLPTGTVTSRDHHALVTSGLVKLRGTCRDGQPVDQPMPTLTAGGNHVAEFRAFLLKYYGNAIGQSPADPAHTLTSKARLGLVTVSGDEYQIVDIGMRMLEPCELYRAHGFPDDYVIAPVVNGRQLPKSSQVRLCGNSVPPPVVSALVRANMADAIASRDDQFLEAAC